MGKSTVPEDVSARYRFKEWSHATAILANDFSEQWEDLIGCLRSFKLKKSEIVIGGGGRSQIPIAIDGYLNARGWTEKQFDIGIRVDADEIDIPTHRIDNFKGGVGIEVEWNNKTEFLRPRPKQLSAFASIARGVYWCDYYANF